MARQNAEAEFFKLPIYYRWDFQTSESGDFEKLIDIIQFKDVPLDEDKNYLVGVRPVDGSKPGFLPNGNPLEFPNDMFKLEGAFSPSWFFGKSDNANEKRKVLSKTGFTEYILPELNQAIEEAPQSDDGEDPLVSIPVYGRYFQKTEKIELPTDAGSWNNEISWVHELNLDRRYRVPASFATRVVQVNQEEYMQECWEQAGEIREANEQLRLGAIGKMVGERLWSRHIEPLSDARFALITQPFHHYYVHNNGKNQASYKLRFKQSGLPKGTISYPFKRVVSQKVGLNNEKLLDPWHIAVKNNDQWHKILRFLLLLLKFLVQVLIGLCKRNPKLRTYIPVLNKLLLYLRVPAVNEIPRQPDLDTTGIKDIFGNLPGFLDLHPMKSEVIIVEPVDIKELRPHFDMEADLLERFKSTIEVPWLKGGVNRFDTIMRAPKINLSMYKHLSEQSIDLMVPGLKNLDNNTAILLEENRKFIAAYMVGLSHEMGRELVWREFPTDQRGTIFRYFWDPQKSENAPTDIGDINNWRGELGDNVGNSEKKSENNLVLAIKADLIRRYPDTIIFAINKKKENKEKENKDWERIFRIIDEDIVDGVDGLNHLENHQSQAKDNSFTVIPPIFSANPSVDMLFIGFPFSKEDIDAAEKEEKKYYFVIMEHPSLPRFGMDDSASNTIINYYGASKVATIQNDWAVTPVANSRYKIFYEGKVVAATDNTLTLSSDTSADIINNKSIEIVQGKGVGQIRKITDLKDTKQVTVDSNWTIKPDNTTTYRIIIQNGLTQGGGGTTITLSEDASSEDIYTGMKITLVDLNSNWDYLSWDVVTIIPESQWVDPGSLRNDVSNIPDDSNPKWNSNSAAFASITYQKPVRIVISSDKFLKPTKEGS